MKYIVLVFIMVFGTGFSQIGGQDTRFAVRGSVTDKETGRPIAGVSVSTSSGGHTSTNALGEFRIYVRMGDELLVQDARLQTVRYIIKSNDDIKIQVTGEEQRREKSASTSVSSNTTSLNHQRYLDSASLYKKQDIGKSIDFVAKSLTFTEEIPNKKALARSLSLLGEIYLYYHQYDLAIDNFKQALAAQKTIATTLLLGEAYLKNNAYEMARETLQGIRNVSNVGSEQRVLLLEYLGDASVGLQDLKEGIRFYNEALTVATKNQMTTRMTDLNSKIADTYSQGDQFMEAEAYYSNSLKLANVMAPKRALQQKEKVADFYNKKGQYADEIAIRKNSLAEIKKLESGQDVDLPAQLGDTITSQRINYKIANAYIAQDKLNEAIPFLQKSIVEASSFDDIIVQKDATRKLSEVYGYKGEFTKALESYQDYVKLVDTLYHRKEQEIARAAKFNREIANTQSRIKGLEQERELAQSKYDLAMAERQLGVISNKRQQLIIYSLVFGLLLTLIVAFLFYRNTKQQKLANNLLALKSLRSQMNPHFIFNALNSVNNFIAKSDERSANRYLSEFSALMRSVLENSDEDFIPLPKEIDMLKLYLKLEHDRFSDKFEYSINISPDLDLNAFQIPPMLLQPYLENAIWHGLRYKEGKGMLTIAMVARGGGEMEIIISDDGIGRKRSAALKTDHQKKQKSKGMGNIKQRVAILNEMYPEKVDISISDLHANGAGTKVTIILKNEQ